MGKVSKSIYLLDPSPANQGQDDRLWFVILTLSASEEEESRGGAVYWEKLLSTREELKIIAL